MREDRSHTRAEPAVGYPVVVRRPTSGTFFGITGAVLGALSIIRLLTLLPSFVGAATDCPGTEIISLGEARLGLVVALIAGGLGVVLSDLGVRREMRAKLVGVSGSVSGIFGVLGAAALLILTLVGGLRECFPGGPPA